MTFGQKDFRKIRRMENTNSILQLVLLAVLFVGINYLAARYYMRADLTQANEHSLSLETQAYLEKIDPEHPVRIIVTLLTHAESSEEDLRTRLEVEKILREYDYHANRHGAKRLVVEFVDVFRNRERARELASQYGMRHGDSILVTCEGRNYLVPSANLRALQEGTGKLVGFRGEEIFTSAILHVIRSQKDVVYFINGHGELLLDTADSDRGMTEASAFLMKRNIEPRHLNLEVNGKIPADARLAIIASPQSAFTEDEVILLKDYLNRRNGRLLVLLDPYIKHGLEELFYGWGIDVQDKLVVEPSSGSPISQNGATLVRDFSSHEITRSIGTNHIPVLVGPCRPAQPDIGATPDETRRVTSLMRSKKDSWAETDYRKPESAEQGTRDAPGPISLAAVAERQIGQQGIQIDGGKLTVFGNSNWVTNAWFNRRGNRELLINCVLWNLDRYTLLDIPTRPVGEYELDLDSKQFSELRGRLLLLPIGVLLLGAICFWARRH